jgi:hypothetical protein
MQVPLETQAVKQAYVPGDQASRVGLEPGMLAAGGAARFFFFSDASTPKSSLLTVTKDTFTSQQLYKFF